MAAGRQVLVDGPAVGDETQAQLEVPGQATVGRQSQDQQRGDQQEAHHQQGHAAAVAEQVRAVGGRSVRPHLGTGRTFFLNWQFTFEYTQIHNTDDGPIYARRSPCSSTGFPLSPRSLRHLLGDNQYYTIPNSCCWDFEGCKHS